MSVTWQVILIFHLWYNTQLRVNLVELMCFKDSYGQRIVQVVPRQGRSDKGDAVDTVGAPPRPPLLGDVPTPSCGEHWLLKTHSFPFSWEFREAPHLEMPGKLCSP